jgi:hypothetical protein
MGQSWRKWSGLAWRVLAAACVAGAGVGCHWATPGGGLLYGVAPVALDITAFSYAPSGPIHTGDTLTFTAQVPLGEVSNIDVQGTIQGADGMQVLLHDDGVAPDAVAGDRVYCGAGQWLLSYGTGTAHVQLHAWGLIDGRFASGSADAADLQVLP